MKKLVLNKETLKVLSPSEAHRVQGGMRPVSSDLPNCTAGPPCTSGCTTGSVNCLPPSVLNTSC
jgi:hypothetical protein